MFPDASGKTPIHFSGLHIKVINFQILRSVRTEEWERINGIVEGRNQFVLNNYYLRKFLINRKSQMQDYKKSRVVRITHTEMCTTYLRPFLLPLLVI